MQERPFPPPYSPGTLPFIVISMLFTTLFSPNFDNRPHNTVIDTLVIHHTNMASAEVALNRLCNEQTKVSAHYLISKAGEIYQLVPDELRAWHAGISQWRGVSAVNDRSIGIELDNSGAEHFPHPQMKALITLSRRLIKLHSIPKRNVVAHYDIAPDRKDDPNYFFDWEYLAKNDIGIFPCLNLGSLNTNKIDNFSQKKILNIQRRLKIYGYKIALTGEFDFQTNQVIIAFKRHFCSNSFLRSNQEYWTFEAEHKLNQLMDMINEKS